MSLMLSLSLHCIIDGFMPHSLNGTTTKCVAMRMTITISTLRLTKREEKDTEYKETVYTLAREHEKVGHGG